jgi:hypothetical protein
VGQRDGPFVEHRRAAAGQAQDCLETVRAGGSDRVRVARRNCVLLRERHHWAGTRQAKRLGQHAGGHALQEGP